MFRDRCIAAVVVLLTVAGCGAPGSSHAVPSRPPSPSPSPSPSPRPNPPAAPAGPSYHAAGFNACTKIDLRPLSAWRLAAKQAYRPVLPEAPSGSVSAACEVKNDGALLGPVGLLVEVTTSLSTSDADDQYDLLAVGVAPTDFDALHVGDGSVAAFSHGLDQYGFDNWSYEWLAQVGNLVVTVSLGQQGQRPIAPPKAMLAAQTLTILRATIATIAAVPRS
ncbi:MAG: hypothetical protein DLM59_15715 [Pseudonocardiales bacterium]|nr:MAG: hypothetical protein DLM59_15715 [Pseudonocardiales bacterium]